MLICHAEPLFVCTLVLRSYHENIISFVVAELKYDFIFSFP